ncbi:TetR/AcrR family transcriptional regulator [Chryseobacterium sp. 1B4]
MRVSSIAATAGVDKKMIYSYFGGLDGLIDEYLLSQDYWSKAAIEEVEKIRLQLDDGGKSFMEKMLPAKFDYVYTHKEAQKLLLWCLSESRKSLKKLNETQEESGEYIFKMLMNPYFKDKTEDVRSVLAIMISGLYYLNMYAAMNGSVFCGIDVNTIKGRDKIKKAISFLLHQTYENLQASDKNKTIRNLMVCL